MEDSFKESPDPLQNRQNASHPETESADATQTKSKNQRLAKQDGDKKRADDLSEAEKPSKKDKTDDADVAVEEFKREIDSLVKCL